MTAAPAEDPRYDVVDLRCPDDPRQLLMKYAKAEGVISSNNLMLLWCRACSRNARSVDPAVRRVIHAFDLAGELVESHVER